MNDLFDRIAGLKSQQKAGILLVLLGLIGGGYYYFFYADLEVEIAGNQTAILKAQEENASYEQRKNEYQAFRLEVNQLLEEQKELLRVLPKKDDIEQFIENVNAQVELAGLSKVSSVRDKAQAEELYMRIPIKMSLSGNYHQINRFFKNVGELKRIVTIADLQLAVSTEGTGQALKADFVAQTFQFIDRPGAPK
ncbi:MAG: hypothetical protein EXR72_17790 [Myxococcales bacterium]|nr:hypothetical protein [Myxococcales bacterium]